MVKKDRPTKMSFVEVRQNATTLILYELAPDGLHVTKRGTITTYNPPVKLNDLMRRKP